MYKFDIGYRFLTDDNEEYEIVNIDKSDEEYPYECFSLETIKEADKIAETEGTTRNDVLYYGDCDFIEERCCFSEAEITSCVHKQKITQKDDEVDFYKNALTSLIDSVLERLEECPEDKLWIFANSGIDSEVFKKLGYNSIARQLEDV